MKNCQWMFDVDAEGWVSGCNVEFFLPEYGYVMSPPTELGFEFCPFCGKNITEIKPEEE